MMKDISMQEREAEIQRILKAFKLCPLSILNLPSSKVNENDVIKKQYRSLSLLVHPDRVTEQLRESAQAAFSKLNEAKKKLLDKDLKIKISQKVNEARRFVREKKEAERLAERQKQKLPPENYDDVMALYPPEEIEGLVMKQVKELLVDEAWKQRIFEKRSRQLEEQHKKSKDELAERKRARAQAEKEWEENREKRVSGWRDWQKKKKKRKKGSSKLLGQEKDTAKTYIRRPAQF